MTRHRPLRPFASPWRLAGRIAAVSLLACLLGNFAYWLFVYLDLAGRDCLRLCPETMGQVIYQTGFLGAILAAYVVPAAVVVFTPIVHFGGRWLAPHLGPTAAILLVTSGSILGALALVLVAAWVSNGRIDAPYPGVVAGYLGAVFAALALVVLWRRWARAKS